MADERVRVYHPVGGRVMTKQSEAASTDIKKIMEKYTKTGLVPQKGEEPRYGDFSTGLDFYESLTAVRQAEEEYWQLPPDVRKRTENDPAKFIDLVMTPEGRKELEEMGMADTFAPPSAPEAAESEAPEVQEPTLPSEPS